MENISCLKPSAHQSNQAIQSSGFFILKNNETLLGYISYINVSLADIKTISHDNFKRNANSRINIFDNG